jgi:hypothetical protein
MAVGDVRVQWLVSGTEMWETDWVRELVPSERPIETGFKGEDLSAEGNTLLICNQLVPYRRVLERLRAAGRKYAVVLLSDEWLVDPCEWVNDPACVGLLRNYIHPHLYGHPKVQVFGLGYKRDFRKYVPAAQSARPLVWAFAGTPHGERRAMLEAFGDWAPHRVHTTSAFGAADGLGTREYVEVLCAARFALCPPGQFSMDTFRMYEALEAGCVPVTLAHAAHLCVRPSYWHILFGEEGRLPFVIAENWGEARARVAGMTEAEIEGAREECGAFWGRWKAKWRGMFAEKLRVLGS